MPDGDDWLSSRDTSGAPLDGGRTYTLTLPLPVPGKLFWSVTIYDAETRPRSTDQDKAALRSLFELHDIPDSGAVERVCGPEPPAGARDRWLKTLPDRGWVRLHPHLRA